MAIGLVDKEWKRPDHGDDDDVLVGFAHKQGRGQEENDCSEGKEHPKGRPFLQEVLDFFLSRLIHRKYSSLNVILEGQRFIPNLHYFPLQATTISYF